LLEGDDDRVEGDDDGPELGAAKTALGAADGEPEGPLDASDVGLKEGFALPILGLLEGDNDRVEGDDDGPELGAAKTALGDADSEPEGPVDDSDVGIEEGFALPILGLLEGDDDRVEGDDDGPELGAAEILGGEEGPGVGGAL
jgi:hypothetical protein